MPSERVAIVTGAARGLGRAYALELAAMGMCVVVNDLGGSLDGGGSSAAADEVVEEIVRSGGRAVASYHDVSSWDDAAALVDLAVSAFGSLDVLVNNAGIARPGPFHAMREHDWDDVVRVHLKGHAAPARHALAYWHRRAAAGEGRDASVIHTSSVAGLTSVANTAAYSAAKAGIIGLSKAICAEGAGIGVRSNVVSPSARTRLTAAKHGATSGGDDGEDRFDVLDPANVAPVVAWLASPTCRATDQVVHVIGRRVVLIDTAHVAYDVAGAERWTPEQLDAALGHGLVEPTARAELLRELDGFAL